MATCGTGCRSFGKAGRSNRTSGFAKGGKTHLGLRRGLPILVFLCLLLDSALMAKEEWVCVESRNFRVFGSTGRKQATALLLRLERFLEIVRRLDASTRPVSVPIDVFLFRDEPSFRPYLPLIGGEPAKVAGYFTASKPRSLIALRRGWDSQETARIIFHEFTHFLTRDLNWPLWLNEGVAEFYSTFDDQGGTATLGRPIEEHLRTLRERSLIPLNDFIRLDQASVGYGDRHRSEFYYAQAWILFHFLRMSQDQDLTNRLLSYVARLTAGQEPVSSFHIVFDPVPIEARLAEYIHRNTMAAMVFEVSDSGTRAKTAARSVTQAEVLARCAELLFRKEQFEQSRALIEQARQSGAPTGVVAMVEGLLAFYQSHWNEAARHFEEAVTAEPDYFLSHFYCALATSNLLASRGRFDRAAADRIAGLLARAVSLRPDFLEGYERLAEFHLHTGLDLDRGIEASREGLRVDPADHELALTLAQLEIKAHDETTARTLLTRLTSTGITPAIRDRARVLLDSLDAVRESAQNTGAGGTVLPASRPDAPGGLPPIVREESLETRFPDDVSSAPRCLPDFANVMGAPSVSGRLEEIRCTDQTATYVITADDGAVWQLSAPLDRAVLYSCQVALENLTCGPFHQAVLAYYSRSNRPGERPFSALAIEVKATQGSATAPSSVGLQ